MPAAEIHLFPCLNDNFGVLVHDRASGATAAIDAPDAAAIEKQLVGKGWRLTDILVTHHHRDHTGGIPQLKSASGCNVTGPRAEATKIAGLDTAVGEGDHVEIGSLLFRVLETPGHTDGHVSYWCENEQAVFVGDTLFAMGCGRLLEGSAETMWASLRKLMALPPETAIYCGHEYTVANARFALSVDPGNLCLQQRARDCEALRANDRPTLPTRLDLELETNPFLRAGEPGIAERIGLAEADPARVFAELRAMKDRA